MLRTWLQRAKCEVRDFGMALVLGIVVEQIVTTLVVSTYPRAWSVVAAGVIGDSVGFYGYLWWRHRHKLEPPFRSVRAARHVIKKYWFAELIDNALRTPLVVLSGLIISHPNASVFVGNRVADVLFFGIVIVTGVEFSDWCLKVARWMRPKRTFQDV